MLCGRVSVLEVTSRSLLDGIFTVKRIDRLVSSGGLDGERDTVTEGDDGGPPVSPWLFDILAVEGANLDDLVSAARGRSLRLGDILKARQ